MKNFKLVEEGIHRGGQPVNDADWQLIQGSGVNQIVKLNSELTDYERSKCNDFGIQLMVDSIPWTQQIFTEPDLQSITDCVGFIKPGTYVHCENGQDRTGLIIGRWRVLHGWTQKQAWDEMIANGFHVTEFGLVKAWFDL